MAIDSIFQDRVKEKYGGFFDVATDLLAISDRLLSIPPKGPLQQTIRYLAAAISNSNRAVVLLCNHGYGAAAVQVARGMFESQVALRYLIKNPTELFDFLEFDAVARWRRLQFYKSNHPALYASFPESKRAEVDRNFARVQKRFAGKSGRLRDRWCQHSIKEMANNAKLMDLYESFYRYASTLHHADPMGLGMLIDGVSLDIQSGPTTAHVSIALGIGNILLLNALRDCSTTFEADNEDALTRIEQRLAKTDYAPDNSVIGTLQQAIGRE